MFTQPLFRGWEKSAVKHATNFKFLTLISPNLSTAAAYYNCKQNSQWNLAAKLAHLVTNFMLDTVLCSANVQHNINHRTATTECNRLTTDHEVNVRDSRPDSI